MWIVLRNERCCLTAICCWIWRWPFMRIWWWMLWFFSNSLRFVLHPIYQCAPLLLLWGPGVGSRSLQAYQFFIGEGVILKTCHRRKKPRSAKGTTTTHRTALPSSTLKSANHANANKNANAIAPWSEWGKFVLKWKGQVNWLGSPKISALVVVCVWKNAPWTPSTSSICLKT